MEYLHVRGRKFPQMAPKFVLSDIQSYQSSRRNSSLSRSEAVECRLRRVGNCQTVWPGKLPRPRLLCQDRRSSRLRWNSSIYGHWNRGGKGVRPPFGCLWVLILAWNFHFSYTHLANLRSAVIDSFGVLLWEVITLRIAFEFIDTMEDFQFKVVQNHERPNLSYVKSERLRSLIANCWDPEPRRRPTFTQVRMELEDILQEQRVKSSQGAYTSLRSKLADQGNRGRSSSFLWGSTPWMRLYGSGVRGRRFFFLRIVFLKLLQFCNIRYILLTCLQLLARSQFLYYLCMSWRFR